VRITNTFHSALVNRVLFRAWFWWLEKSAPHPRQRERQQWKHQRYANENDNKQIGVRRHSVWNQIRSEIGTANCNERKEIPQLC
jgi:hypothetical protein